MNYDANPRPIGMARPRPIGRGLFSEDGALPLPIMTPRPNATPPIGVRDSGASRIDIGSAIDDPMAVPHTEVSGAGADAPHTDDGAWRK